MKNLLTFGTILTLASFTFPAMAAGNGAAAVQMATQVLGATLHGQTQNGQACVLSFERTQGGLLLGQPVLGSYELTIAGRPAEFDFIASSEATGSSTDMRFETIIHEDSSNSPDEGGFQRGFTQTTDLDVAIRGNSITVRIVNGVSTICAFTR